MAKFKITKETTVAGLKQQFAEQIGGTLRVYDGRSQVKDDVVLISLGAKTGELECRTSRTVSRFEEAIQQEFNLNVKVYTIDDWVHIDSGVTLENVAKIQRQATKASMKQFIAYKRTPPRYPTANSPDGRYKVNKTIEANLPCPKSIEFYENRFKTIAKQRYADEERALKRLFIDLCPHNSDVEDILIKCSTLNDFYSTQIWNIHEVARHFKTCDIDKRLKKSDYSLVNDLALVNGRYNYSFATKYCSHHKPKSYPIFDSFVGKMLTYFTHRDQFCKEHCEFSEKALKDYPKFVEIIKAFRNFYGLDYYTLKQIDIYLWLLGKDAF